MSARIAFCITGKTGLGHLRRTALIAEAVRERARELEMILLANAPVAGLSEEEKGLFAQRLVVDRPAMAETLNTLDVDTVVVDTAVVPGLHRVRASLCLVLRAVRRGSLARFQLEGERKWDLILAPHPRSEWDPTEAGVMTHRLESVGWIYRSAAPDDGAGPKSGPRLRPRLLVAAGGGGTTETMAVFRDQVAPVLTGLRGALGRDGFEAVQVLGPRAPDNSVLPAIDQVVRPGAELPRWFRESDAVISTAGYNSVLELAVLPVPVLLTAIPRRYDDQESRAGSWGPRLGCTHDIGDPARSIAWLIRVLSQRKTRPAHDVGPSGARTAARLLLEKVACVPR